VLSIGTRGGGPDFRITQRQTDRVVHALNIRQSGEAVERLASDPLSRTERQPRHRCALVGVDFPEQLRQKLGVATGVIDGSSRQDNVARLQI